MQRYKALLEKTKTLFWNRWFTTNRKALTKDMGGALRTPITHVIPGQSTGYGSTAYGIKPLNQSRTYRYRL